LTIQQSALLDQIALPSAGGAPDPNETIYMIRHAEAHPSSTWDDGDLVGAGQWRALDLPHALRGKISPDQVYSIDPARVFPGACITPGDADRSYVWPSLTVAPRAIANNPPYRLVSDFEVFAKDSPKLTSDLFFDPRFSDRTVLLAWEHEHIPPTVRALLARCFPAHQVPRRPLGLLATSTPSGP